VAGTQDMHVCPRMRKRPRGASERACAVRERRARRSPAASTACASAAVQRAARGRAGLRDGVHPDAGGRPAARGQPGRQRLLGAARADGGAPLAAAAARVQLALPAGLARLALGHALVRGGAAPAGAPPSGSAGALCRALSWAAVGAFPLGHSLPVEACPPAGHAALRVCRFAQAPACAGPWRCSRCVWRMAAGRLPGSSPHCAPAWRHAARLALRDAMLFSAEEVRGNKQNMQQ